MPKYQVTFEEVVHSRTPSPRIETIEARDAAEVRAKAKQDADVVWGYRRVGKIIEVTPN